MCQLENLNVPVENWMKVKESEMLDKYRNLKRIEK